MPEILRARNFAIRAHQNQTRKYTNEPYFNHCQEVVDIVRTVPHDKTMIAAAYLHDTLEDTDTTSDDLYELFGFGIESMVNWLTDISRPHHGNRAARKAIDRNHIGAAPAGAQTVKLADLISNTRSIVEHDPNFAKVYLAEKLLILGVLTWGDRTLHALATQLAHDGLAKIKQKAFAHHVP